MDRNELYQYIQNEQPNICQISVLQNGNEVYGAEWNGYQRTDCAHIMSATKSVMSLLVGIAVDRGWIGSVEDKVLSYFPEYPVKRGEKTIRDVTIKHLLTMRALIRGTATRGRRYAPARTGRRLLWTFLEEGKASPGSLITGRSVCTSFPASFTRRRG